MLSNSFNIVKHAPSSRMHKINENIHRELAKLINNECKDPRLGMVTITSVDTAKDLSNSKVFITVLEESKLSETISVLNKAAGFLRTRVAQGITLRKIPVLKFLHDESTTVGNRINSIFNQLKNNNNKTKDDSYNIHEEATIRS